jgi:hypothetical protein
MDQNASQSILMVGGILLAISVLSFFVYAIATFGGFANNMNAQIEGSEVQKYNQHFFQYQSRCNITFQDVVSAINFAKDWNDQNDYSYKQVADNSVEFATNIYIIDENGNEIKVFGNHDWIKEDIYSDNQKVKDVLNKKLNDPKFADYYYAVNVKSISVDDSHSEKGNYYVLNPEYGPSKSSRKTDLDINTKTGFIQKVYFTVVSKSNYASMKAAPGFQIINKQGKKDYVEYKIKNKEYFKMTAIED